MIMPSSYTQEHDALLDAVDAALLAVDENGRITYANAAAQLLLNAPVMALQQRSIQTLFASQQEAARWQALLDAPTLPDGSVQFRMIWEPDDGPVLPLLGVMRALRRDQLSTDTFYLCTLSPRPQPLSGLLDILATSGLLNAFRQPVIISDGDDRLREVNDMLAALLDTPQVSLIGKSLAELVTDDHQQALAELLAVRRHGESQLVELTLRHPDGMPRVVLISDVPMLDESGALQGSLSLLTDITTQKRIEEDLRSNNAELDAFSRTVAHDLKSPLAVLLGFADLMQNEFRSLTDEETEEYLRTMGQTTQKMLNIVDELLLLSQMRKGDVELVPINMDFVLAESLHSQAYLRAQYKAEIVKVTDPMPPAMGYAGWVEAVWSNYISNAIKYGSTPPRVEIGAEVQGNWVRYWVRDNGEGLTDTQIAQLFKPFQRLQRVRTKGHGVGLTIVKRIVEKLGGQVGIESVPGEGSIFSFTLARVPDSD